MMPGNTSTLVRSRTCLRSDIQRNRFPFCTPLPSRAGCSRYYQKNKKQSGINYDQTKVACDYLHLHCYSGKIIRCPTFHASETGIQSFLETIFDGPSDAKEATKANESPNASRKRKTAHAAAEKQYIKATADAKTAQTALATAQAACTKTSKDVASTQQHIEAADKAKTVKSRGPMTHGSHGLTSQNETKRMPMPLLAR
jgi:hypothetical protein